MEKLKQRKTDYTPAVLDKPSQLLLEAANRIERGRWFPQEGKDSGAQCAWVAIVMANDGKQGDDEPSNVAGKRFAQHIGVRSIPAIFDWNDAPDRTKQEVLAKLRAAALS